jgi:hypothetical protein
MRIALLRVSPKRGCSNQASPGILNGTLWRGIHISGCEARTYGKLTASNSKAALAEGKLSFSSGNDRVSLA